ncbi:hypothetical protein PVAND_009745 [Polypedilum vanderplanki]|uniref:poly(ADP-ribose) glycohydrolase n=1 Tax=Polypedilum vanderplanki TaxID=319348 RepID=A0A9J6CE61_POLVA|nr:hypothetical protein PVAND_009745 [Polypedilum vanderplanki]
MALVMLPSELPWWSVVIRKITTIENTNDLEKILEVMQKIHDLCNISLDPEEDQMDSTILDGLRDFITNDMDDMEREKFYSTTLKCICRFAKSLKNYRPPRGICFSLQQNSDSMEFEVKFIACLLANSFFSTYPKRTNKTHPTLKDFNFTHFFNELNKNSQKAKFRCFLWYFEWLDQQPPEELERKIKISRKVMSGKQWLTIEDWLECKLPLCPMDIKHGSSRLENSSPSNAQIVFSQSLIGSTALHDGNNQESIQLFTHLELLTILLFVERLEDNEVLLVENVMHTSRVIDPKGKALFEKLDPPKLKSTMICMDAECYKTFPATQFEEDNTLRELNKCLLAFRQNTCAPMSSKLLRILSSHSSQRGRLSPIGESFNNSSRSSLDCSTKIVIEPNSPASTSSPTTCESPTSDEIDKRRNWLNLPQNKSRSNSIELTAEEKRRGRFIVLGSSGECLPVNRQSCEIKERTSNYFASDNSDDEDDEVFYSARNSLNDDELTSESESEENFDHQRYSIELETPENRFRFAKKLRDALKLENGYTESTEDCSIDEDEFDESYAVDINIEGSRMLDEKIKIKRGTSTGFILEDDSSFPDECQALPLNNIRLRRNQTSDSSKYSFDTDESELEEIYDHLSQWLNDPLDSRDRKIGSRDKAVLKFADSLLKRALSESHLGEPIDDTVLENSTLFKEHGNISTQQKRKMIKNFRSLSLEIAKYKNIISSQILLQQKRSSSTASLRSIATGSWGCGQSQMGDVQFKTIVQWLAASVANVPVLIYYTCSNENLSKLDTVVRVLHDRKWTVGELLRHTLFYAKNILNNPTANYEKSFCFFDKLIGLEKSIK